MGARFAAVEFGLSAKRFPVELSSKEAHDCSWSPTRCMRFAPNSEWEDMKPAGDRHGRHVMTLIHKLASMLDARVAAEDDWQKMNRIAATAATEFEYQRLVARWTGADRVGASQGDKSGKRP
jgi:hypothetical protein